MCTTDVYTRLRSDGRQETVSRPSLCPASRQGQPCSRNIFFQHNSQPSNYAPVAPVFAGPASYPPPYLAAFPPTPTYTPSYTPRTSTPTYRSGDDSDRSYHSSASERRRGVYVSPRSEYRRHEQGGRTVLVQNPPMSSTPPQAFTYPRTAPSSPSFANTAPFIVDASPRGASSRRPMIVDERSRNDREGARIHIEFHDGRKKKHSRQSSSTSSYESRHSYNSATETDEVRRRRREIEALKAENRRLEHEAEMQQRKLHARILKANAEIASREAVPVPPTLKRSSTAAKATRNLGSREEDLAERIQQLELKEQEREGRSRASRREQDDAQKERLKERMMPRRRATVGPGSRRHRVEYTDGVYRLE